MKPRRTLETLFRLLVHLCRFGLAALFLFAAGAKLFTVSENYRVGLAVYDFAANLANLLPAQLVWPAAAAVIASEILIGILLIIPRTARLGAALAALLLLFFAAYALYYVYVLNGEPLECGCFGRLIASQLGVSTALRNLALLLPCALVFFALPRLQYDHLDKTVS